MQHIDRVVWVGDDPAQAGAWKSLMPDLMLNFKILKSLLLLAIEYKVPGCSDAVADVDRSVWLFCRL